MEKSLFHKDTPEQQPRSSYDLIGSEIGHLKKGTSIRHGSKGKSTAPPWLLVVAFLGLCWLYLMDPFLHAWYKGDAIRAYLYLHNYGSGPLLDSLTASGIFTSDELETLNHRPGPFQDYYASAEAANHQAEEIINYMTDVRRLHTGQYQLLDPVAKMRYFFFIHPGIFVPTQWSILDPKVGD